MAMKPEPHYTVSGDAENYYVTDHTGRIVSTHDTVAEAQEAIARLCRGCDQPTERTRTPHGNVHTEACASTICPCWIGGAAHAVGKGAGVPNGIRTMFEHLQEIARSGVEFEDDRVGYVTVQIDRRTWEALAAWR